MAESQGDGFPTRAIYRALLVRGLEPAEAANLTAWLAGLPSADVHWTIGEVDELVRRRRSRNGAVPDPSDLPIATPLTWQTS